MNFATEVIYDARNGSSSNFLQRHLPTKKMTKFSSCARGQVRSDKESPSFNVDFEEIF